MFYELCPRFDSRKSFYKKAMVEENDSTKTLFSYEVPVVEYSDDDTSCEATVKFLPDSNYSNTTRRHVWDFVQQMCIPHFMEMYNSLKFKSLPDFLRKIDCMKVLKAQRMIMLFNNGEMVQVYKY